METEKKPRVLVVVDAESAFRTEVQTFIDHDGIEAVKLRTSDLRAMPKRAQDDLKEQLGKVEMRAYVDGAPFRLVDRQHPAIVRRRAIAKEERLEKDQRRAERKKERQRRKENRRR